MATMTLYRPSDGHSMTVSTTSPLVAHYKGLGWATTKPKTAAQKAAEQRTQQEAERKRQQQLQQERARQQEAQRQAQQRAQQQAEAQRQAQQRAETQRRAQQQARQAEAQRQTQQEAERQRQAEIQRQAQQVQITAKPIQKYGEILTLVGGQRINPQDPNYATYAKQMGITPITQAPKPTIPSEITTDIFKEDKEADQVMTEAKQAGDIAIPNVAKLEELSAQGLTEKDIVRRDGQIFIKSDSPFASKMAPKELLEPREGQLVPDTATLQKYAEMGLLESDIERKDGKIFIKPDSEFLKKAPPLETTKAEPAPAFDDATAQAPQAPEAPKTAGDAVSDLYDTLISQIQAGALEGVEMTEIMAKKNEANIAVETARQAIADKKLIDAVEMESISKDEAIPMTLISRQQAKYSSDEYITNLKMVQDYNNKLILSKMAEGNFLEAQRINKDIANDNYEIQKLQLDQLIYNDKIKQDEYDRMEKEVNYERELALNGYSYIPNAEAYNEIVKRYNITPSNFNNFIYKDPTNNKLYLKDLEEDTGDFTSTQQQKLEQAGLKGADRQSQLNFLYGKKSKTTVTKEKWDYAESILKANPDASDEELKKGLLKETDLNISEINSIIAARTKPEAPEIYTEEWFKTKINQAKQSGYSTDEIIDLMLENYSEDELFKVAQEQGFAKWYTGKKSDIKRYIENLMQ